ncbi:MAG: hypothetical protein QM811_16745 [Pirellulales bacterium]
MCGAFVLIRNPHLLPTPAPAPVPTPAPIGGEQFRAIFARTSDKAAAKQHARSLAEIAEAAKEILAYDWGADGAQSLKQGHQVALLRKMIRDKSLKGWSYGSLYPELAPTLDTFFTQRVGREPGQLTPQDRERWLATFSDLYVAVDWAADNL